MRGKAGMGAVSNARICGAAVGLCPHPNPPPRTGGGGHGRGGGWAALLLPPHAGEGRDGGGVGREGLRRSGRTLPPPQPSTADGGRGATGVEAAGPPCSFFRMRGKAGMGGQRPTRGSATKQQHLAASAFHLATTPAVRC